MIPVWIAGLVSAACAAVDLDAPTPLDQLVAGEDWSLPAWAQPTSAGGISYGGNIADLPIVDALGIDLSWRELEPQPGIYDWSRLEAALAGTHPVWVRLFASDVAHVPAWLAAAPGVEPMRQAGGALDERSEARFLPLWHPTVDAAFRALLADAARRRLGEHPHLRFVYVPAAWRWSEWELFFVDRLRRDGYTPERFLAWFDQHLGAWAAAFPPQRLVFTGFGHIDQAERDLEWAQGVNDLENRRNRMTDLAVAQGMGVRTGNLEIFNAASDLPSWGAPAELHAGWRRQVVDGQHPLHRDRRRIRLAENEAFGDPRMMPGTEHPWFVTQVTLKTLQLDLNWISVQPCTWQLNPALLRWARTCLGSTAATSPDAWVALRTWEDPTWRVDEADARRIAADARLPAGARAWHSTGRWPLRYWERFLSCRHVPPDASPVPCAPPELPIDAATMELRWGRSWEACRTAVAQGQRALALAVDPAFAANLGPRLRVLVTARGSGPARWRLVYDRGPGREPGRSAMQEQSADRFTTTTIAIADADLRQGLPGGVDLRLEVEGLHDLAFRLVRLVRVDPPPLP